MRRPIIGKGNGFIGTRVSIKIRFHHKPIRQEEGCVSRNRLDKFIQGDRLVINFLRGHIEDLGLRATRRPLIDIDLYTRIASV